MSIDRMTNLWQHVPAAIDDGFLVCPRCGPGEGNLHHGQVRLYERAEDEPTTTVITAGRTMAVIERQPSRSTNNPSSRRNGIAIAFACEICSAHLELLIAQHKGNTIVEWRVLEMEGSETDCFERFDNIKVLSVPKDR